MLRLARGVLLFTAMIALTVAGTAIPAWASAGPTVAALAPTSGSVHGGTRVTVHGTGFSHVQRVYFGRYAGRRVDVLSRDTLRVTAPAHSAGMVDVRVVTSSGRSPLGRADRFTYVAPPRVTAVAPLGGTTAGGTRVTVSGRDFVHVAAVAFGATRGTHVTVLSSTRLSVVAPAHSAGVVSVRVRSAYGTSAASTADHYTYLAHIPPDPVSAIRVARTHTSITLSWTNPVDVEFAGVRVVRSSGDQAASPTSGTVVADLNASATTITDSGLAPGSTYTYVIYAHDVVPDYSEGAVRTVTTQADTGIQWGTPTAVLSPTAGLTSVSCPTDTFCAALDNQGNARTFDGTSWSAPTFISNNPRPVNISCASSTFCVAPDGAGRVVTFDGHAWSSPVTVDPATHTWLDMSCAAPAFCVGVLSGGNVVMFNGTAWSGPDDLGITAVSCTSATFCMGADPTGTYVTFDGTTWSSPAPISTSSAYCPTGNCGYIDVSCSSATFCVVAGDGGTPVAMYNGTSWTVQTAATATDDLIRVTCPTDGTCVVYTGAEGPATSLSNGQWSPPVQPDPNYLLNRISCAPSFCMAVAGPDATIGTWP